MADNQDLNQELTPAEEGQPITPAPAPAVFTQPDADLAEALQPQPAPALPSTPESQEETDEIVSFKADVEKKQKELERTFGRPFTFQEAQQQIVQERSQTAEQQALQAQQQQEAAAQQKQEELEKLNTEMDAYQEAKNKAQELNLPFQEDEAMENLLAERTKEIEIDTASISQNQDDIADAVNANEEEVKKDLRTKRELNKQTRAAQIANAEQQQEDQERDRIADKAAEENVKTVEKDMQEFEGGIFGGMTTGNKVLAAISIALSGIGQGLMGGGSNTALQILQKAAEERAANYRKSKELDFKKEMAAQEAFYKNVRLEIDKKTATINNAKQLTEINKLNSQIAALEIEARNKQKKADLIEQGKSIPTELMSKEDRERSVFVNGQPKIALNKEAAGELRKFKNEVEPAQKAIQRVLYLSKQGSRLSRTDRAKISTEMQGIIGNLRIPFLGPGAMTDTEYERLRATLGDPNAFFALPSVERKKLETVFNKLQSDLDARYNSAGITPPISKRQQLIEQEVKNGRSRDDVIKTIDRLIEKGQLSQDYML